MCWFAKATGVVQCVFKWVRNFSCVAGLLVLPRMSFTLISLFARRQKWYYYDAGTAHEIDEIFLEEFGLISCLALVSVSLAFGEEHSERSVLRLHSFIPV